MSRPYVALLVAALLGACGASEAAAPDALGGTVGGIGSLPEALSTGPEGSTPTTVTRSTVAIDRDLGEVGGRTAGNRVIVIGDSIMASTSARFGGEMCLALVPQHWAVEVDAESGRFVEFGSKVLDERLPAEPGDDDWDAAVVMLGNNYRGDVGAYEAELFDILDRLAPRPTVLFTVTEFRPDRVAVNDVIQGMLRYYPELQVVDWASATALDPSLIGGDGLHLTDAGRKELAAMTAAALGESPTGRGGECLDTEFEDDSAVLGGSSGGSSSGSSGGGHSGGGSSSGGGSGTTRTTVATATTEPQTSVPDTTDPQTTVTPTTTGQPDTTTATTATPTTTVPPSSGD